MPSAAYFDQQKRIATARQRLFQAMQESGENEICIWIAALSEAMKRVSDWNLDAERDDDSKEDDVH